jgi:hypothetical protein
MYDAKIRRRRVGGVLVIPASSGTRVQKENLGFPPWAEEAGRAGSAALAAASAAVFFFFFVLSTTTDTAASPDSPSARSSRSKL